MLLTDAANFEWYWQSVIVVGLFLSVVFLHELGHYIAFRICRLRPKIKIGAIIKIEEKRLVLQSVGNNIFVYYLGIYMGLIPIVAVWVLGYPDTYVWFLVYVIMCGIDLLNIYSLVHFRKSMKEPAINCYYRSIRNLQKDLREAKSLADKDKKCELAEEY
jgi:hypothetical protein